MKKLVFTILIAVFVALTMHSEQWIRVNQLGYLPISTKVAVWMSNEASMVQNFELVDAYTGQVAYRGQGHTTSAVYEIDLQARFQRLYTRRCLSHQGGKDLVASVSH